MNAAHKLAPLLEPEAEIEAGPALSDAEVVERSQLKDRLRLRRSVDHIAKSWYGGIFGLILIGLVWRTWKHSESSIALLLGCAAVLTGLFCVFHAFRAVRLVRSEAATLRRLRELDARAPKTPELF